MWPYLALSVPVLFAIFMLIFYNRKVVWWELALPIITGLIVILIFKMTVQYAIEKDTEYRGSLITHAEYYEYYETWVSKTCSYTVSCGKNCTRTVYYDCSYCDHNPAEWYVVDNYGQSWQISQNYYTQLMRRWNATPEFVELNRNIHFHGSCGKDGDMYRILWDNKILTSEAAVTTHEYTNKVQVSHNTFKLPYISEEKAKTLNLYKYPETYKHYMQEGILGIDSLYPAAQARYIKKYFQYLNGYYGTTKHAKVFVLMFFNRNRQVAYDQEAYWDGGNDNEVVVCIDIDPKTKKLNWVRSFGWCDNKRVHVDIREDIMEHKVFDFMNVYTSITNSINNNYKPKNFKDFDYLEVDIPTGGYVLLWLLVIGVSIFVSVWAVTNEIKY